MKENLVYVVSILYKDEVECTHSYMYGVYSSREVAKSVRNKLILDGNEWVSILECKVDDRMVDEESNDANVFTKKDIKSGMVVELRGGKLAYIQGADIAHKDDWSLIAYDGTLYISSAFIKDDLTEINSSVDSPSKWDIVAVYEVKKINNLMKISEVWSRDLEKCNLESWILR